MQRWIIGYINRRQDTLPDAGVEEEGEEEFFELPAPLPVPATINKLKDTIS